MRNIAALALVCLALAGCDTLRHEAPTHFIVFFGGKSTDLPPDGQTIVKSAAARVQTSHPGSVVVESGGMSSADLSGPRFVTVRQALIADGVPQDLIVRSSIPGPKLTGVNAETGDQRVEIRLLAKPL